ncbi:MAG: SpoIID/LytB domain-containing protein [Caldisericia bacterium]
MKRILTLILIFIFLNINFLYASEKDVRVLLYKNPFNIQIEGDLSVFYSGQNIFNEPKIYCFNKDVKSLRLRVGIFLNLFDAINYSKNLMNIISTKEFFISYENEKYNVDIGDFISDDERDIFRIINKDKIPFSINISIEGSYLFFGNDRIKILSNNNFKDGIIFEIKSINDYLKVNGRNYRGYVYIYKNLNTFYVINKLNIEDYLKGVVPSEMPETFNFEALKAQAVASRTYVLSRIKDKNIYDVTSTPDTQAYFGMDRENEKTNKAVSETEDEIITYEGKIIEAVYHSTSGGYTENNENVWNSVPYPYLRGVESPYEEKSPHFEWNKTFTNYKVQRLIKKYIFDNKLQDIGEVLSFEVLKRGVSPRVVDIKIVGMYDDLIIKGTTFQSIFGLKSTWFNFEFKSFVSPYITSFLTMVEMVPLFTASYDSIFKKFTPYENSIYDARKKRWDIVVFTGKGWGHGVGMSQWGAQGLSENGFNYIDILKYYYTGVEIKKYNYGY